MKRKHLGKAKYTPDGLVGYEGPVLRYLGSTIAGGGEATGLLRTGYGFKSSEIWVRKVAFQWATNTESAFMNIIEELKGNYDEAKELWQLYEGNLVSFRSAVKNDVSSLEAASRKTTTAVQKMERAYGDVIRLMNSDEMLQAVENAERLANAMSSLANLQSHKLTLAVVDNVKENQ